MVQSLTTRREEIDVVLGEPHEGAPAHPAPHPRGTAREPRPLRIVQISDPHIGPFMSVARLREITACAVEADPDLVLLTGDFLTMESQSEPELLSSALEPLRALEGASSRDHEAPHGVARALRDNGIRLLVDESEEVETPEIHADDLHPPGELVVDVLAPLRHHDPGRSALRRPRALDVAREQLPHRADTRDRLGALRAHQIEAAGDGGQILEPQLHERRLAREAVAHAAEEDRAEPRLGRAELHEERPAANA